MVISFVFLYKHKSFIHKSYSYYYEYKKSTNDYIKYIYYQNNLRSIEYFNCEQYNRYHRKDGPSLIQYDKDGKISYQEFYIYGILVG